MLFELLILFIMLVLIGLISENLLKRKIGLSPQYPVSFYVSEFNRFLRKKKYWHFTIFSYSFWIYGIFALRELGVLKFEKENLIFINLLIGILIVCNLILNYKLRKIVLFLMPIYFGYQVVIGYFSYNYIPIQMFLLSFQGIFLTLYVTIWIYNKNK